MARCAGVLLILLMLFPAAVSRTARYDATSGRVRVFYLGDAWGATSPMYEIMTDPRFVLTPVPAMEGLIGPRSNVPKFQRSYLPRRYSDLVAQQDIIILSDTQAFFYTTNHISWFSDAVERDGLGLLMVGGRETVNGGWGGTTVEMVLPGELGGGSTYEPGYGGSGAVLKPVAPDPDSEFVRALPIKEMPPYLGAIVFSPKPGATTILEYRPKSLPLLLYHEIGEGSSMVHSSDWTPAWGSYVNAWEYFPDFVSNMLHLLSGLTIPQDPALMHALREHFGEFEVGKGLILSLIEFADKFGANTRGVEDDLGEIVDGRRDVTQDYIEQEYQRALGGIQELLVELMELQTAAVQLKDRALFWVYVTEVLTLTGTSLVCGAIVWMLMVKRKLYREVRTTRPSRMSHEE